MNTRFPSSVVCMTLAGNTRHVPMPVRLQEFTVPKFVAVEHVNGERKTGINCSKKVAEK